jgi:TRAP-type C4-dicarboxylate transport system substrate-binding protein
MTDPKKSRIIVPTRRTFVKTSSAAAVSTFFIGRGARANDPEITLKLATAAPRGTPWWKHLSAFKKRIKEGSGGRIKIKAYPGSALGDEISTLDSTKRNRIQVWAGTGGAIGSKIPEMALWELPYLFPNVEAADHVLDSLFDTLDALMQKNGFKLLFFSENGHRSIGMKGGFVHSPKDLVGKKMRAQQGYVHENTWKALGASPVPIPVTEVLTSLQNGVVDGFDNTPLFTFAGSWYQAVSHFTLTRHSYQPGFVVMAKAAWDALSPADQALIAGDRNIEAKVGRKGVRKLKNQLVANFTAAGIEVHESTAAELKAFKAATAGTHGKFKSKYGGSLLGKVKKLM